MSAAVLARCIRPISTVVPAAGATKCRTSMHHVVARRHSTRTSQRAKPAEVKLLEKKILDVNKLENLSDQQKYRTSVRLLALLDRCNQIIEIEAVRANVRRALGKSQKLLRQGKNGKPADGRAPALTHAVEELDKLRVATRRLAGLQWMFFRLFIFAPWEDVDLRERLAQIPPLVWQMLKCRWVRVNCSILLAGMWKWRAR